MPAMLKQGACGTMTAPAPVGSRADKKSSQAKGLTRARRPRYRQDGETSRNMRIAGRSASGRGRCGGPGICEPDAGVAPVRVDAAVVTGIIDAIPDAAGMSRASRVKSCRGSSNASLRARCRADQGRRVVDKLPAFAYVMPVRTVASTGPDVVTGKRRNMRIPAGAVCGPGGPGYRCERGGCR